MLLHELYNINEDLFRRKYGHGYCWALALALNKHKKTPCVIFYDEEGPFHVVVRMNNKLFDAYGYVSKSEIEERHQYEIDGKVNTVEDVDGSQTRTDWESMIEVAGEKSIDQAWEDYNEIY